MGRNLSKTDLTGSLCSGLFVGLIYSGLHNYSKTRGLETRVFRSLLSSIREKKGGGRGATGQ